MVKNQPAMWQTCVPPLGWEDPLEEDVVTHSSILAWRIPTERGAWQATIHGATITNSVIREGFLLGLFSQFSSVAQSCPTLCDSTNRSTPGLPVHHKLPEFTQTHTHRVSDAIQPSHPLLSSSPPASNPSKHQGLFQ